MAVSTPTELRLKVRRLLQTNVLTQALSDEINAAPRYERYLELAGVTPAHLAILAKLARHPSPRCARVGLDIGMNSAVWTGVGPVSSAVSCTTGCGFFKTGEFVCKPLQAWIFSR